jgi:hypothetical protein
MQSMNFDHKGIISRLVDGVVFDPGNQGPVPPRGQNMAKKDEIKEFVSDLRISEPIRRIQGKNLYFGIPSRNPAVARGSF